MLNKENLLQLINCILNIYLLKILEKEHKKRMEPHIMNRYLEKYFSLLTIYQ